MSVNNEAKTTKLVTQWNISAISYNEIGNTAFEESYMEEWLNDTTVDGFLGNLRDYEDFIVTDAVWDATMDSTDLGSITRPNGTTTVTSAVGLLNMYEYQSSNDGGTNGYLNNGLLWWSITPESSTNVRCVTGIGTVTSYTPNLQHGIRPSINLKSSVRIVDGEGTLDNPYRLNGDNDTELSGTLLNTRYSGEYIRFGSGENDLYRIVSHENGSGTKITSAEPLKSRGEFIRSAFDSNKNGIYSSSNTIGAFLNNDYLNTANGYLIDDDIAMIEDSTTWYLGIVDTGILYKLAKYADVNMSNLTHDIVNTKIGLLRYGELMTGDYDKGANVIDYFTLTRYNSVFSDEPFGLLLGSGGGHMPSRSYGVRPSMNLKSNVVITGGDGTKNNPFTLELAD